MSFGLFKTLCAVKFLSADHENFLPAKFAQPIQEVWSCGIFRMSLVTGVTFPDCWSHLFLFYFMQVRWRAQWTAAMPLWRTQCSDLTWSMMLVSLGWPSVQSIRTQDWCICAGATGEDEGGEEASGDNEPLKEQVFTLLQDVSPFVAVLKYGSLLFRRTVSCLLLT